MSDLDSIAMLALVGIVGFAVWQAYEVKDKATAAAAQAVQAAQDGAYNAATGNLTASQIQAMDAGQAADILRAGGTQQQAAASVQEMNKQIADGSSKGVLDSLQYAWNYWGGNG